MRQRISLLILGAALAGAAAWAGPLVTFTLDPPDGNLLGAAGATVGWGYQISTDSDYVVIQSIVFGDLTPIGIFSTPGIPLNAASPGNPITVPWLLGISGLEYSIFPGATLNASTLGQMTLIYDTFTDADLIDQVGFGDSVVATFDGPLTAQITVNEAGSTTVPEPATSAALALGLALLAARRSIRV